MTVVAAALAFSVSLGAELNRIVYHRSVDISAEYTEHAMGIEVPDSLLDAMIAVESKGDDMAVGDNGRAYGCLQIHQEYLDDANEVLGTSYVLKDMFDRETAKKVVKAYIARYLTEPATEERMARVHNGGPKGAAKESTLKYWRKVEASLPSKER